MLIIGCGNRDRGDDAAGVMVAERLNACGVAALICSGECSEVMNAWSDASDVILIDCVVTGNPAGTVHVWNAGGTCLTGNLQGSTHGFGVAEAVELSRALRRLPAELCIYGIEGKNFDVGSPLSAEVEAGIAEVVRVILGQVGAAPLNR